VGDRETIAELVLQAGDPPYEYPSLNTSDLLDARRDWRLRLAEVVLAALDLDAREAAAREEGRREAAEAIAVRLEALERRTPDEHGIVAGIPEIAEIARAYATERGQDGAGT
jgi:hypothetical protein